MLGRSETTTKLKSNRRHVMCRLLLFLQDYAWLEFKAWELVLAYGLESVFVKVYSLGRGSESSRA